MTFVMPLRQPAKADTALQHFQSYWTLLVNRLKAILQTACTADTTYLEAGINHVKRISDSVAAITPAIDQAIYVELNKRPFFEPADSSFEPCGVWHDDDQLVTEGDAKLMMQTLLSQREKRMHCPSSSGFLLA